jgi:predicted secreted Zn-dependent protease
MMFRKTITAGLAVAMLAVPTLAQAAYSPPEQIPQHAQCGTAAGSGTFGYLGAKGERHDVGVNSPGADGKPGTVGHLVGQNNSSVCGNR